MSQVELFVIEYMLHGDRKTFIIRTSEMNNAHAWQWASCDAGIAPIPKPGRAPLRRMTRPMAERFGITEVQWRPGTALIWEEAGDR
ncbi:MULTISPECIES: DUF6555 family protein [Pseudomonas]|uniref:Uncharacterized protein n=1 Tax=Pseudomonas koreensis TaxID=198620 RepID=A0A9X3BAJ6_9PSED|nr:MULTISPECIES: DUF6555 family protein [Pseudomonas]MBV4474740.1 hypothetical protein [Pseudomonas botevensis]MCU7247339.1 hypothetical protein [Pseudomonas koreensis]